MPAATAPPAPEQVERWRYEQLRDAHYPPAVAHELSRNPDVDLHQACALLADGCDLETALHILL